MLKSERGNVELGRAAMENSGGNGNKSGWQWRIRQDGNGNKNGWQWRIRWGDNGNKSGMAMAIKVG
jgi:hypothetical protein